MDRRIVCSMVAVSLFVLPTLGQSQEARDILEKAIQAHGGTKLSKFKAQSTTAKGTINMPGQMQAYEAEYTFLQPNKFHFALKMEFGGNTVTMKVASDGKKAWEQMGPTLREMDKKKRAEFDHNVYTMYVSQLVPLRKKVHRLTKLGESKVDGKTVVGIKVQRKGKRDVSLFFDKKTWLLTMSRTRIFSEFTNEEVTQESYMTGYRDMKGRKIFDKLTVKHDGKVHFVEEYSNQRMLRRVDPKMFAMPKGDGS